MTILSAEVSDEGKKQDDGSTCADNDAPIPTLALSVTSLRWERLERAVETLTTELQCTKQQHTKLQHQVLALQADLVAAEVARQAAEEQLMLQQSRDHQQLARVLLRIDAVEHIYHSNDYGISVPTAPACKDTLAGTTSNPQQLASNSVTPCSTPPTASPIRPSSCPLVIDVTTHYDDMCDTLEQQNHHPTSASQWRLWRELSLAVQEHSSDQLEQRQLLHSAVQALDSHSDRMDTLQHDHDCLMLALSDIAVEFDAKLDQIVVLQQNHAESSTEVPEQESTVRQIQNDLLGLREELALVVTKATAAATLAANAETATTMETALQSWSTQWNDKLERHVQCVKDSLRVATGERLVSHQRLQRELKTLRCTMQEHLGITAAVPVTASDTHNDGTTIDDSVCIVGPSALRIGDTTQDNNNNKLVPVSSSAM